ncbi:hypothetical protein NIES2134_118410 [Thermostichus vulcanus NIES-2134]|nr:hypothetical protein NIES2134_118410 [Thermostichus vulcanus NIES-2134]
MDPTTRTLTLSRQLLQVSVEDFELGFWAKDDPIELVPEPCSRWLLGDSPRNLYHPTAAGLNANVW